MGGSYILMLCLGLAAIVGGGLTLLQRGGSERAVYGRRIGGAMLTALGLALAAFALGMA